MGKMNKHQPWIFNTILWVISFIILLFAFAGNKDTFQRIDYIYTLCFLCTLIPPVLFNIYLLMPKLLSKGKGLWFIFAFVVNLLVFTKLNVWFFSSFIDKILPDFYFISYHSEMSLLLIFSIFLIATMLLKLAEEGFYLQKRERAVLQIQKEKAQLELSLLRAQLQPHFLFNALNVVYALSLEDKQKTTQSIVQLSDILRYVIYDTNTKKVALQKEIELLKNYVDFQRNRTFVEDIHFGVQLDKSNYEIFPMLLLPLVENAFKHGAKGVNDFVHIEIITNRGKFEISIQNTYELTTCSGTKEKSGVGIDIVARNLKLVYPERHCFTQTAQEGIFSINLKIDLND